MNSSMNDAATSAGIIGIVIGVVFIGFLIALIPLIFYILSLQKTLKKCAPENRAMEPGMIWLMLVPLVNMVWHFFVVNNMAKSLGAEFQKRGMTEEPEPGKKLGTIMCVLMCCSLIPILGSLCSLGFLVCWIMYWLKMVEFSKKLGA